MCIGRTAKPLNRGFGRDQTIERTALVGHGGHARTLEARLSEADRRRMFEYALKLWYPNGRSFDLLQESERPLKVGQEFDAFGHTWRIAGNIPPSRFRPDLVSEPQAFACHPVSESGPHSSH
jgi:hypothetical protein